MNKKIISKGYTVEVTSWENDGDNYRTISKTYSTKEEALAIKRMCMNLFTSCNNGEGGIGNMSDSEEYNAKSVILNFFTNYPQLLDINNVTTPQMLEKEIKEAFPEENIGENWLDYIHDYIEIADKNNLMTNWYDIAMNYNYSLMGGSEYYLSRVSESVSIYYSDKDVYLEEITE